MLKLNPSSAQTYMNIGKLGSAPVWKRAEKLYGSYSVCDYSGCKTFDNKHIGFTEDGNEDRMLEKNEYKFVEIRVKYKENVQIMSGMNYAEVYAVKRPTYKIVDYPTETWFLPDGTEVKFKNGLVE
jgi:hypothetical protein